jgi:hypothetical protein
MTILQNEFWNFLSFLEMFGSTHLGTEVVTGYRLEDGLGFEPW